jgi:hypothetical protein
MYYHVLLGSMHIDLVRADSEQDAIKKVEDRFGPANTLSIMHNYVAVKDIQNKRS